MLADASFDAVNLFFPDPWPKKRHHKRRIMRPEFVAAVARILKRGGLFHVATDWANYAEQITELMASQSGFDTSSTESPATQALAFRAPTKFEARGRRLGHEVADFYYRKADGAD
jgi:tRNA (guanine-N7-)-methyltransferase